MTASRVAAVVAVVVAIVVLGACDSGVTPPAPVANRQFVCLGVPRQACEQAFDISEAAPGTVAQVVVRCIAPVCTLEAGEAEVNVAFTDARRQTRTYGWAPAGAPPPPVPVQPPVPLTIAPVCVGLPLAQCIEMAATGPGGEGVGPEVASITVRCADNCTTGGSGTTTYEFKDGRPSVTIMWAMGGGG